MKIKSGLIIATVAGSLAGVANAEDLQRTALEVDGYTTPHGYVYVNQGTGERIVSFQSSASVALRAADWTWDNSIVDGCAPNQDDPLVVSIFTGVMDDAAGDLGTADAVNYWSDWFEAPGDTIISGMTFGYFSQMVDPGEDGVDGQEYLFAFTENDRANSQTTALAHSPIIVGNLFGAEDDGAEGGLNADGDPILAGDGIIDFAEGNYWIVFLDFALFDTPTDIEVADTDGVSNGAFGTDSTFSGIAGVDVNVDGLFNCGFYIGFRQPGVAEGDGMIDRFPELAVPGFENPDGLDIPSLANVVSMGVPLVGPSADASSYDPSTAYWPQDPAYVPLPGEAVGSTDAFGFYNAVGVSTGTFFFGGFDCDPAAVAAPFYTAPWSSPDIRFNINGIDDGGGGCNDADIAEPFGVLDLGDINAFVAGFLAQDPISDIAPPAGVFDLADLNAFVQAFLAGCP